MNAFLFWIFAVAACGGAVAVVVERNVVRMAFWLIVALGSVAGLFFLLGADFVGATQFLIYVGGTVVLLIFGVMLTATGAPSREMTARRGERMLAGVIGLSLLSVFGVSVLGVERPETRDERGTEIAYASGGTTRAIGIKLLGLDTDRLRTADLDRPLDSRLAPLDSSGYLLPFEIASVHLLVVLIGAAYLARAKRRRGERADGRTGVGG